MPDTSTPSSPSSLHHEPSGRRRFLISYLQVLERWAGDQRRSDIQIGRLLNGLAIAWDQAAA